MPTRVEIQHRNRYEFDGLVTLGPHTIRLRPAQHTPAEINDFELKIHLSGESASHYLHWQSDAINNRIGRLVVPSKVSSLEVVATFVANLAQHNPFDFFVDPSSERYPFSVRWDSVLHSFLDVAEPTASLKTFCETISSQPRTVDFLVGLNKAICRSIAYEEREQPGIQSCSETISRRTGSCRDTAWLMVNVLRSFEIPARYVAGYLIELKTPENAAEPNPIAEDTVNYHAWVDAFLPGAGWIGLDPTSGYLTAEQHIPLAVGVGPSNVTAIEGSHSPGAPFFSSEMSISRMPEDATVTRTYEPGGRTPSRICSQDPTGPSVSAT